MTVRTEVDRTETSEDRCGPLSPCCASHADARVRREAVVELCCASDLPLCVVWGPERVPFYNDAYLQIRAADRLLGEDFAADWRAAWAAVGPAFERCARTGAAATAADVPVLLAGEERYFTFSFSPVRDAAGAVAGVFHALTETTRTVLAERRLAGATEQPSDARDPAEALDMAAALERSEARFHRTFDHMLEGCQIIGFDWRYLYVNGSAAFHARRSPEELVGRTMMELFPGIEATEMFAVLRQCMEDRVPDCVENRFEYPDGRFAWFDLSVQPSPEGIFVLSGDITARKRAEVALRESEARFRGAFEHANVPTVLTDLGNRFLRVNDAFARMFGYTPAEMVGMTMAEVTHPDHLAESYFHREILLTGNADHFVMEKRYLHRDGHVLWGVTSVSLVRDSDGQAHHYVGQVQDITARKQAEQKLLDTTGRLRALMDALPIGVSFSDDATCARISGNPAVLAQFAVAEADNLSASAPDLAAAGRQVSFFDRGRRIAEAELPLQRAVAENRPIPPVELEVLMPDGRRWFMEASGAPVYDDHGTVIAGVAVTVDVTARKAAEAALRDDAERFATLLQLQAEVTAAGADRAAVLSASARHALTITGATGAVVEEIEGDELVYRAVAGEATPYAGLRIGRANSISGRCIRERRPLVCDDTETDDRVDRAACRRVGIRSLAVVPLVRRGRVEGVLKVTAARPQAFGGATISALRLAAAAAAAGLSGAAEADAEESARRYAEQFKILADNIPQLTWMAHPDGEVFWFNRRWYEYTGTTPAQMHERGWEAVHDPAELARLLPGWERALATGEPFEDTFPLRRHDGQMRWHLTRAVPIRDGRAVVRWFGTCTDISEQRELAEDLRHARAELEDRVAERTEQLQAANKELEAFSYSVSHDLRAPLRAVDGFTKIVIEDFGPQLPAEAREYLNDVRNGARLMGRLVDDLLAFSRLGRKPVARQRVDVGALVRGCLSELRPGTDGRRVEFQVGDLPPCEADPALLKQVWLNLLSNALKYSSTRDPAVIEVGGSPDGPTYTVRDNGVGFDPRYAHKLFGVFQRLHRTEEYEGTGVGLAMVQRVVHRHGGRVWAEAELNRGATFSFTVPPPTASPALEPPKSRPPAPLS